MWQEKAVVLNKNLVFNTLTSLCLISYYRCAIVDFKFKNLKSLIGQ